ncbi:hypothetical protein [Nonomuraea sp. NPDC005650]|uniref:hypothetical protein n=1 Tax=Nonomuraea sp. NPDC005650 TaxID=3157045 RepID=UPI0033B65CF0
MSNGNRGASTLMDVTDLSLHDLETVESAALREALTLCLSDDKDPVAAFSNSIAVPLQQGQRQDRL